MRSSAPVVALCSRSLGCTTPESTLNIETCPTNGSATVRKTYTSGSPSGFGATRSSAPFGADAPVAASVSFAPFAGPPTTMRASRSRADGDSSQIRSSTRSTPVPVRPEQTITGTAPPDATSRASVRSSSAGDGSLPSR